MSGTRQPVVVGVDRTAASHCALLWAAHEAAQRERPLRVLHVRHTHHMRALADALALVDHAVAQARALAPDIAVTGEVRYGRPATVLRKASRHAALLVVAGHGGPGGLPLGSVSGHVTTQAYCPVLAVHPDQFTTEPGARPRWSRPVVVGADDSADSESAVGFAFEEASLRGIGLLAIRVWDPADMVRVGDAPHVERTDAGLMEAERHLLAGSVAGWRRKFPDVPVALRVVVGHAAKVLTAAAAQAELIVVGAHRADVTDGPLLGAVSRHVLHSARCSVVVVHHREAPASVR